jgi:uncharacterized protein with NRDE domain
MCTVIYCPSADGILLTSNREERFSRKPALAPVLYDCGGMPALMPVDTEAGGTWAGVRANGEAFILFNGGFEAHTPKPHYRLSRGIVLRQLLQAGTLLDTWQDYPMQDIEPFSLVVYQPHTLHQLVWDGGQKHKILLPANRYHLWSSATLYDASARQERQIHFQQFMRDGQGAPEVSQVMQFLHQGMAHDPKNRFVMNRDNYIGTVSISAITLNPGVARYHYWDLRQGESSTMEMPVRLDKTHTENDAGKKNGVVVV